MRRSWVLVPCVLVVAGLALAAPGDDPPVSEVAVGDFDGDGKPDVAAGLPDTKVGKLKAVGVVRVLSGSTGALLQTLSGTREGEGYGTSIAAVGDIDGDGAIDLAIAAPYGLPSRIHFVSGRTGKQISVSDGYRAVAWGDKLVPLGDGSAKKRIDMAIRWVEKLQWRYCYTDKEAIGMSIRDAAGYQSSGFWVGDVDADGWEDFAVSDAFEEVDGMKNAGRIRVVSGHVLSQGDAPDRKKDLLKVYGTREGEFLGIVVAAVGDWDKNGNADFAVGTPGASSGKNNAWTARVLSGLDGKELWKASGAAGDVSMGGITLAGDADGDGRRDLAVGTPGTSSKAGAVTLFAAKDATPLWTVKGAPGENLGEDVLPAPDADGDGVADLVVVSPGAAVGGKRGNGYVRILSGKTGATITLVNPLAAK